MLAYTRLTFSHQRRDRRHRPLWSPSPTCSICPLSSNEQCYTSPPKVPYALSPPSYASPPETPSPSYSTSLPASSASPPTHAGIEDLSAKIVSVSSSPGYLKPPEDVNGEALAALTLNRIRSQLQVAPVEAPGSGDDHKSILSDLAIQAGASKSVCSSLTLRRQVQQDQAPGVSGQVERWCCCHQCWR